MNTVTAKILVVLVAAVSFIFVMLVVYFVKPNDVNVVGVRGSFICFLLKNGLRITFRNPLNFFRVYFFRNNYFEVMNISVDTYTKY